ncbi:LmbE family protein [Pseudanabaena biceps PCC 7429]|uniref:LmbE family protein n=2 Tax=Pseudanabaena TaxID=1152 RepID=L8MRH2_9CYAN|nr:LmbE family protein [Pseudanabaena biceps PCC 7429]
MQDLRVKKIRRLIGYKIMQMLSCILQLALQISSKTLAISQKSVIIFAPHQDDETLGCGGLIALKRERGIPVKVVFITDGQLSGSGNIEVKDVINIRKKEALEALNILGIAPSDIYFINQKDGSLQELCQQQQQQLVNQLVGFIASFNAEEIYVPHRHDCHPDHEASYKLVVQAIALSGLKVDLWQYPVWMLWQNPLNPQINLQSLLNCYHISIKSVQKKKQQAIACYQSQIISANPEFLFRFYADCEIFFRD